MRTLVDGERGVLPTCMFATEQEGGGRNGVLYLPRGHKQRCDHFLTVGCATMLGDRALESEWVTEHWREPTQL